MSQGCTSPFCLRLMSSTVTERYFPFRSPKRPVGTHPEPSGQPVSPPKKLRLVVCAGPLLQWWISHATRAGEGSSKERVKILILASVMAAARVRGFQGTNYGSPDRIVACAKHWVAYGAAEGGRDYNTTEVSERTLREIYFPPFKAALDAGVGTFMSAFNDLDGVPCTANSFTLSDVLRGEWHFDGVVVSDYNAVKELITHGVAADGEEAAALALSAGVDMDMFSRLYGENAAKLAQRRKSLASHN